MKLTDDVRKQIKDQLIAKPTRSSGGAQARNYRYKQWESDALGVNPNQIQEATAHLRSRGCTAEYTPDGQLIVTSDRQFREVAKASGMWDGKDGYAVKNTEGQRIFTGREQAQSRKEWKRRLRAGEIEF